jgi:Fe-S-cluster-containing dehydrogenase component
MDETALMEVLFGSIISALVIAMWIDLRRSISCRVCDSTCKERMVFWEARINNNIPLVVDRKIKELVSR